MLDAETYRQFSIGISPSISALREEMKFYAIQSPIKEKFPKYFHRMESVIYIYDLHYNFLALKIEPKIGDCCVTASAIVGK